MKAQFRRRILLACTVLLPLAGCSTVEPAGSLGYLVDGETRFRPVPKNYRHVPPQLEPTAPQFKVTF
jgi:hypothetical protein